MAVESSSELAALAVRTLADCGLSDVSVPLWVGFSGGADSTAALMVLRELGLSVTAVHLHHGLRGKAADEDAAWCEAFCRQRNIPLVTASLAVPAQRLPGEGIEAAARRCRLAYWSEHAGGDAVVVLGHHVEDCLEDLFLRLARGSNVSGLTGLRPLREMDGVRYLRPLLFARRAQIEQFLIHRGITDWCRDDTNLDVALRRNAVRHELLPLWRRLFAGDGGLLRSLAALREDEDMLAKEASRHAAAGGDTVAFRALHPALQPRVLRHWLSRELGRDVVPRHEAIERLRDELREPIEAPRLVPIGDGVVVEIDAVSMALRREPVVLVARPWRWQENPVLELPETGAVLEASCSAAADWCGDRDHSLAEWFAAASLPPELVVRSWSPGDRMVPFGRRSEAKLKNLFASAHVPSSERVAIPVITDGERIIWVPGVRRAACGQIPAEACGEAVRICYRAVGCH